jgi:hypothetical protein
MIISLPDIHESSIHVVWAFIAKFYIREDLRFTEEGMGIQSEPQVKRGNEHRGNGGRYD